MKTSNEINELAGALSKAQGAFTNPPRNRGVEVKLKTGGKYIFHYTTLDTIIDMIRGPMALNGLSFTQSVTLDSDWVLVTTRILHSSGQWIEDELPVKPEGFGPQQVGSALTYGKRYSLAALLGIASDEDDDANLGSGHTSEEIRNNPPPQRNSKAKAVAQQRGMKTADELVPPVQETTYQKAIKEIEKAVRNHDKAYLAKIEKLAADRKAEGFLTEAEDVALLNELQLAEKKIEAVLNQEAAA